MIVMHIKFENHSDWTPILRTLKCWHEQTLADFPHVTHEENNLSQMYIFNEPFKKLIKTLKSTGDTFVTDIPLNSLGYNINSI